MLMAGPRGSDWITLGGFDKKMNCESNSQAVRTAVRIKRT